MKAGRAFQCMAVLGKKVYVLSVVSVCMSESGCVWTAYSLV